MPDKNTAIDLDNARYDDQKAVMRRIIADGQSPFLPANLPKYHPHPIIKQGKYWYITANHWPYPHTKHHYMIIATHYWTSLDDITPAASQELIAFTQWLVHHFPSPGGALCLRFGDSDYSGATIDHLHWHYLIPDLDAPDYDRIRFAVGKKPEKLS